MKIRINKYGIMALMIVLIFSNLGLGSLQEDIPSLAQIISEKMTTAVENFKEGKASEGALLLLDVVKLTRPESAWPEGFIDRIDTAEQAFKDNDFVCAVSEVKRALDLVIPEYPPIAPSDDEDQVSNLAKAILSKIQSAGAFFKMGNADRAVILILEALLLLGPSD